MNDSPEANLELVQMSTLIKSVTSEHLYGFIEAYMFDRNVQNGIKSVDIDVAVHNEWNGSTVRSDVMGHVTFSSLALKNANLDLTQDLFRRLVEAAFDNFHTFPGEGDALDAFLLTLQNVIPLVVAVDVSFEQSSESSGNIPPKIIYDSEKLSSNGDGAGYTTVSVAAAVVVLAAGIFVYASKKREVIKDRHLLTYIDSYDEENGVLFDPYETSYKTEEGVQFIPVPAKKETISKEHKKFGLIPKVYVQASSPLEVVYGASFSHRDQARVAKAHGNRNFRPSKVGGKRIKKNAPLEPMSAISEIIDDEGKALVTAEHDDVEHDEFDVSPPLENGGCTVLDRTLDATAPIKTPVKFSMEDQSEEYDDDDVEDDILSYDNLSRHDDTDCVSFSPVCDVDWSQNTSVIEELNAISPRQVKHDQGSISDTYPLSLSTSPEKEVEIDNFVDKLESLIAARSRRYHERKTLEIEMEELKIIRSDDTFNSPEDSSHGAENEVELVEQRASNELLETEEIQPKKLFPYEDEDEEDFGNESTRSSKNHFHRADDSSVFADTLEESSFPIKDEANGEKPDVSESNIDDDEAMVRDELEVPEEVVSPPLEEIELVDIDNASTDKTSQNVTENLNSNTSDAEMKNSIEFDRQSIPYGHTAIETVNGVKEVIMEHDVIGTENSISESDFAPEDQISATISVEESIIESNASEIDHIQDTDDTEESASLSNAEIISDTEENVPALDADSEQQTPITPIAKESAREPDQNFGIIRHK